ncbi:MAG: M15 family metallopeptidase [Myxococcales bacterium]|nr:M15 family metallopeptidase [Myxococcales bacterium]
MLAVEKYSTWVAGIAVLGGVGSGLLGLARWWNERERLAIGYVKGKALPITVVSIDGKPVEVDTARAYRRMHAAASRDGVAIRVVSGFRTMAEQEYLYGCYQRGDCNNGNLAAKPGYSNHQSGHALDLNARDPAVGAWLRAHAREYGFRNTVASEPWHWEYWP